LKSGSRSSFSAQLKLHESKLLTASGDWLTVFLHRGEQGRSSARNAFSDELGKGKSPTKMIRQNGCSSRKAKSRTPGLGLATQPLRKFSAAGRFPGALTQISSPTFFFLQKRLRLMRWGPTILGDENSNTIGALEIVKTGGNPSCTTVVMTGRPVRSVFVAAARKGP